MRTVGIIREARFERVNVTSNISPPLGPGWSMHRGAGTIFLGGGQKC